MSNVRAQQNPGPRTRAVNARLRLGILSIAAVLAMTACTVPGYGSDDHGGTASSSDEPFDLTTLGVGVAGLPFGEVPPIPVFPVPDALVFSVVQHRLNGSITAQLQELAQTPGVRIDSAPCDGSNDGSPTYVHDQVSFVNNGDGTGRYVDYELGIDISIDIDGYFSYTGLDMMSCGDENAICWKDSHQLIYLYRDGSGDYTYRVDESLSPYFGEVYFQRLEDGSSLYRGEMIIINNGDGSGEIDNGEHVVRNEGGGIGEVDHEEVAMAPMAPLPPLSWEAALNSFPSIEDLDPARPVCGVVMVLSDGALFDFESQDLRPEASTVLDQVSTVIADSGLPGTVEVTGHTDSIGDEAFNWTLSENRAQAVADALAADGVVNSMDVAGYGGTRPIAPNNIDGQDYPGGRQFNRRIEVFLPF